MLVKCHILSGICCTICWPISRAMKRQIVWFFIVGKIVIYLNNYKIYIPLWFFNFLLNILHFFSLRNCVSIHEDSSIMLGIFLRPHNLNLSLKYYNISSSSFTWTSVIYSASFLSILIMKAELLFSFYLLSIYIRALRFILLPLFPTDCLQATSSCPIYR